MLKCALVPDIVILSICVLYQLYQNRSMKIGARAMTLFFPTIASVTLTLALKFWIAHLCKILLH